MPSLAAHLSEEQSNREFYGNNPPSTGNPVVDEVAAERRRQIAKEGWDTYHDDAHNDASLAKAAACYALGTTSLTGLSGGNRWRRMIWPRSWAIRWWKPKTRRYDLIRAAAMLVAEVERLDRASSTAPKP